MSHFDLQNKWILITGASSGLGKEIAFQLAAQYHCNLVLVARRKDRLLELEQDLEAKFGVEVDTLPIDLSAENDVARLTDYLLKRSEIQDVILNAGVTYFGKNIDISATQLQSLLDTNVKAVVSITNAVIKQAETQLQERHVLIVSSMAAFCPAPYQAVYSGTKAFLLAYAQAFQAEIEQKNISISVFAPGGIKTEMTAGEQFNDLEKWLMPVKAAAAAAINSFKAGKFVEIPGFLNKLTTPIMQLIPRKFLAKQMAKIYKKSLDKNNQ